MREGRIRPSLDVIAEIGYRRDTAAMREGRIRPSLTEVVGIIAESLMPPQ